MKQALSLLFAALMVAGLLLSSYLIVASLEAAAGASETQMQPPAQLVASQSLAEQGRVLFVAKGCIVCHRNDNVQKIRPGGLEFDDIPDLTHNRFDAEYLQQWLHDPQSVKPATWMPNLDLSDQEILALTAFLTAQTEK